MSENYKAGPAEGFFSRNNVNLGQFSDKELDKIWSEFHQAQERLKDKRSKVRKGLDKVEAALKTTGNVAEKGWSGTKYVGKTLKKTGTAAINAIDKTLNVGQKIYKTGTDLATLPFRAGPLKKIILGTIGLTWGAGGAFLVGSAVAPEQTYKITSKISRYILYAAPYKTTALLKTIGNMCCSTLAFIAGTLGGEKAGENVWDMCNKANSGIAGSAEYMLDLTYNTTGGYKVYDNHGPGIGDWFGSQYTSFKEMVEDLGDEIINFLKIPGMVEFFSELYETAFETVKEVAPDMGEWNTPLADALKASAGVAVPAILYSKYSGNISNLAKKLYEKIYPKFEENYNKRPDFNPEDRIPMIIKSRSGKIIHRVEKVETDDLPTDNWKTRFIKKFLKIYDPAMKSITAQALFKMFTILSYMFDDEEVDFDEIFKPGSYTATAEEIKRKFEDILTQLGPNPEDEDREAYEKYRETGEKLQEYGMESYKKKLPMTAATQKPPAEPPVQESTDSGYVNLIGMDEPEEEFPVTAMEEDLPPAPVQDPNKPYDPEDDETLALYEGTELEDMREQDEIERGGGDTVMGHLLNYMADKIDYKVGKAHEWVTGKKLRKRPANQIERMELIKEHGEKMAEEEKYNLGPGWEEIKNILADETFDDTINFKYKTRHKYGFEEIWAEKEQYSKRDIEREYKRLKRAIPENFVDLMDAIKSGDTARIEAIVKYDKSLSETSKKQLVDKFLPKFTALNTKLSYQDKDPREGVAEGFMSLIGPVGYFMLGRMLPRIFGRGISDGSGIADYESNINGMVGRGANNQYEMNNKNILLVKKSMVQFMSQFRGLVEDWKANSIDINGNVVTDCQIRVKNGLIDLCDTWNISNESGMLTGTVADIIKQLEDVVDHCKKKLQDFENGVATSSREAVETYLKNQDSLAVSEAMFAEIPTNKLAELSPEGTAYEIYKRYRNQISNSLQSQRDPNNLAPNTDVSKPQGPSPKQEVPDSKTMLDNMLKGAIKGAYTKFNNADSAEDKSQIEDDMGTTVNTVAKNKPDLFSFFDPKTILNAPDPYSLSDPKNLVPQPDGNTVGRGVRGNKPKAKKFRSFMRGLEEDMLIRQKNEPVKPMLDGNTAPKITNVISGTVSLNGSKANVESGYGSMEVTDERTQPDNVNNLADALSQVQTRIKTSLDKVSQQMYMNALDTPDKMVSFVEAARRPITIGEAMMLKTGLDMYPVNNQTAALDAKNSKNVQLERTTAEDRLWRLSNMTEENLQSALDSVKTNLGEREVLLGQTLGDDFQNVKETELEGALVLKKNRQLLSEASQEISDSVDIIAKGYGANDMTREYINRLPFSVKQNMILALTQVGGPNPLEHANNFDLFYEQGGPNRPERLPTIGQVGLLNHLTGVLSKLVPKGENIWDNVDPDELLYKNIKDKFIIKGDSIAAKGMYNQKGSIKNLNNEENANFLDLEQLWGTGFYMAAARSFYNRPVQQLPTKNYVLKTSKVMEATLKDQSQKNPATEALINEVQQAVAAPSVDDGTFLELQEQVTDAVGEQVDVSSADLDLAPVFDNEDNDLLTWEDIEEIEEGNWVTMTAQAAEEEGDAIDIMDYLQGLQVASIEETIQNNANSDTLMAQAAEETDQDPTGLGLAPIDQDDPDDDLDEEANLINFDDDDDVTNHVMKKVGSGIGEETNTIDPRMFLPGQFSELILENFKKLSARHGYLNRPLNLLTKAEMAFGFDTAFAVNYRLMTVPISKDQAWAVDKAVKIAAQTISYAIAKRIADKTFVRQLKDGKVDQAFNSTMNRLTVRKMALQGQQNLLLQKTNNIPVPPKNPELDTQSQNVQYNSYKAPYTMKGTVLSQNARELAAVDELGMKMYDAARLALTKMETKKDPNFRRAWNLFNSGALGTEYYRDMMIQFGSPKTTEAMAEIFYKLGSRTADATEFGDTLARLTGNVYTPKQVDGIFSRIKDGVQVQNNIFRNMGQSAVLTCCYDGMCQDCKRSRLEKKMRVSKEIRQWLRNKPGEKVFLPDSGPSMSTMMTNKAVADQLSKALMVPSCEPGFGFHSSDARFLDVTMANMEYSKYKRYADTIDSLTRGSEPATGPGDAQVYPTGGTKDPEAYGAAEKSKRVLKQGVGETQSLPKDSDRVPYTNDSLSKLIESARYRLQVSLNQLDAAVPIVVRNTPKALLDNTMQELLLNVWLAFSSDINKLKLAAESKMEASDNPQAVRNAASMLSRFAAEAGPLLTAFSKNSLETVATAEELLSADEVYSATKGIYFLDKSAKLKEKQRLANKMVTLLGVTRNQLEADKAAYFRSINENQMVLDDQKAAPPVLAKENKAIFTADEVKRISEIVAKEQDVLSKAPVEEGEEEDETGTSFVVDELERIDKSMVPAEEAEKLISDPMTSKKEVRRVEGRDPETAIVAYRPTGKTKPFNFDLVLKSMVGFGMKKKHLVGCAKCSERDPDELFHVKKQLLCKKCIGKGVYTDRTRINKEDLEKDTIPARSHPKYGGMIAENEEHEREMNFENKSSWDNFAATIPSNIDHQKIEKQLLSRHITYGEPDAHLLNITAIAVGLATHKYDHLDSIPDTLMSNIYGGLSKFSKDTKRREYINPDALDNFTTLRRYIKFDANNLLNNIVNK